MASWKSWLISTHVCEPRPMAPFDYVSDGGKLLQNFEGQCGVRAKDTEYTKAKSARER